MNYEQAMAQPQGTILRGIYYEGDFRQEHFSNEPAGPLRVNRLPWMNENGATSWCVNDDVLYEILE